MEKLPNLPVGRQYFAGVRKDNAIYVDKTEFIYNLCSPADSNYFLSRPRRFGKSLTLDPIGRMDTIIITTSRIFLFEFKMNETAKDALQCIKDRNYAASLRHRNKPITGVGVVFSVQTKGVADWSQEEL